MPQHNNYLQDFTVLVKSLVLTKWYNILIVEAMEEYCSLEAFKPQCWKNEVVLVEHAYYGRRRTGKCISAKEASRLQGPDYFGCYASVLHIVSRKCSGKKKCEINIPDTDLEQTMPCLEGLKMFLEVRYSCVEGTIDILTIQSIVSFSTFRPYIENKQQYVAYFL